METEEKEILNIIDRVPVKVHDHALKLIDAGVSKKTIVSKLISKYDLSEDDAIELHATLKKEYFQALKEQADKDVLYGALWCAGGIIATVADIGLIFWGAIVFGGYQLIKGLSNQAKYKSTSSSKIKDTEVLDSVS
tara:strand:- start:351 stop:758 length:408 start_codon:yes stop_codon:yes gene_type:complete